MADGLRRGSSGESEGRRPCSWASVGSPPHVRGAWADEEEEATEEAAAMVEAAIVEAVGEAILRSLLLPSHRHSQKEGEGGGEGEEGGEGEVEVKEEEEVVE